jgi:glycosyltransferase involved in cell wall biosynthesis
VVENVPGEVERSRNRIVFTGTLTFKKGIVGLARAWGIVAAARPEAELHIFGKDISGMEPQLRRECGVDASRSIVFHGHTARSQVLQELARARAAVFPSYAEAFAFAPLEAMAAGCPTIFSTRTSGPEAVIHNVDGLLVDPDHPHQIAQAILSLLDDDALARRLGAAGRDAVAARFSLETILPAMEMFYLRAIDKFQRRVSDAAALAPSEDIHA